MSTLLLLLRKYPASEVFIHQYIQSLRHKLDELTFLASACSYLHVIALSGTTLLSHIADNEIAIDGFKVAVYVRDTLHVVRRTDLDQDNMKCLWLEILFPNSKGILFGTFYRSPNGATDFIDFFPR